MSVFVLLLLTTVHVVCLCAIVSVLVLMSRVILARNMPRLIYVCMCVCVYTYVCTYVCMHVFMYMILHIHLCMHIHTYIRMHVRIRILRPNQSTHYFYDVFKIKNIFLDCMIRMDGCMHVCTYILHIHLF